MTTIAIVPAHDHATSTAWLIRAGVFEGESGPAVDTPVDLDLWRVRGLLAGKT